MTTSEKNTKKPNPKPIFFSRGAAPHVFGFPLQPVPPSSSPPKPPQLSFSFLLPHRRSSPIAGHFSSIHQHKEAIPTSCTSAPIFPPLQPTLPISSPLPAGLLFFFTHRSQPPLHTPDNPSVSRSSAHRAPPLHTPDNPSVSRSSTHRVVPIITRTTDRPSPLIYPPQHRQPPLPSP